MGPHFRSPDVPAHVKRGDAVRRVAWIIGLALVFHPLLCRASIAQRFTHFHAERSSHEIEQLEEKWRQALIAADPTPIASMLAEDFLAISANGTLSDKSQYMKRITSDQNHFTSIDLMDMKVRLFSKAAIVTSQVRLVGRLDGRTADGVFRYTKVYHRAPTGEWLLVNFEATRVTGLHPDETEMHNGVPLVASPRSR
jgi:ketosteroid isomerase-like protein